MKNNYAKRSIDSKKKRSNTEVRVPVGTAETNREKAELASRTAKVVLRYLKMQQVKGATPDFAASVCATEEFKHSQAIEEAEMGVRIKRGKLTGAYCRPTGEIGILDKYKLNIAGANTTLTDESGKSFKCFSAVDKKNARFLARRIDSNELDDVHLKVFGSKESGREFARCNNILPQDWDSYTSTLFESEQLSRSFVD